jgi:hypothetical protein
MKPISAIDFHNKWLEKNEDSFLYYGDLNIDKLGLSEKDSAFFLLSGLPKWVAPNLYFYIPENFALIFDRYFAFGEDADDGKLCIDTKKSGQVIILDENDVFRCFLNSSVQLMVTSIFCYMEMIDSAIQANGKDSFVENKITLNLIEKFMMDVKECDPIALQSNAFWEVELKRVREKGTQ